MRVLIIGLLILISNFPARKFQKLRYNSQYDNVKEINPGFCVDYWEYRNYDCLDSTTEIIYSSCERKDTIPFFHIDSSFNEGCHPTICYDYVVYVRDQKINIVTSVDDFLTFMGRIDNLQEGLLSLTVRFPEFYFRDDNDLDTGSYSLKKDSITFILLKDEIDYPRQIGQYKVSINRDTHGVVVERIKDFHARK